MLTEEFHWTESDFSLIVSIFTLAYAISYTAAGKLMDWIGERKGFALAVALWSAAAMAHGLVEPLVYSGLPWLNAVFAGTVLGSLTPVVVSVAGFSAARFALGLAEGGNFPGAIKTVGLWHPKSERAMSTGIFNSGSNVGIIVAAYAVPFVVVDMQWGWSAAFYLTGGLGFVWLAFWLALYQRPERHPRVSPAELAHIRSDPPDSPVNLSWFALLGYRQTWAYTVGMFLVSPVWWFYLYWMPKFLENNHGIDLEHVFWPLLVVYLLADVGSIGGGGLSSWLIRRGASVNVARKTAFLACALGVLPVVAVARVSNLWIAVLLVGLAAASHAGFSANLYTIVSDTVPRKAVGSVVGIGGTAACVGMLFLSTLIGYVLDWTEAAYGEKDYLVPFVIAGSAYLIATAIIQILLPRLEPMALEAATSWFQRPSLTTETPIMRFVMTPRERVQAALNHTQPDYTPCDYYATPEIHEALLRHFGLGEARARKRRDGRQRHRFGGRWCRRTVGNRHSLHQSAVHRPADAQFSGRLVDEPLGHSSPADVQRIWRVCRTGRVALCRLDHRGRGREVPLAQPRLVRLLGLPALCAKYADMAIATGGSHVQDFINGVAFGRGIEQVLFDIASGDPVYLYHRRATAPLLYGLHRAHSASRWRPDRPGSLWRRFWQPTGLVDFAGRLRQAVCR